MEYKFLKNGIDVCGRNKGIEDDLSALHRFLKIVGVREKEIDNAIERGVTLQRTSCVIERIAQLTADNVNQSWVGNGKIAMISSSLGRGGAERQVVSCLGGIVSDKRWKEVQLFCYRIDTSGGRFSTYEGEVGQLGVKIDEFGGSGNPDKSVIDQELGEWRKLISLLPDRMKKTIIPLYQRINQFKPSILHSWQDGMNIDASIAAMIAGVPSIVLFARSMRPDRKTALHIRGRGYLDDAYRSILKRERAILAHNSNVGSRSYSEWLGKEYGSFPIIHNGVDFETIENDSNDDNVELILEELGIGREDKVVGSVFRVVEEKNPKLWIDVASEVIAELDNTHFVIVGGGIQLELMKEYVQRKGIDNRMHLVGQSTDIASWLKRMDLFFLTSKVEGLPNVLIEAQGFGVPVISTDAGGSRETFIDGVTGSLITNEDKGEISRVIVDWLNRSERWIANSSANAMGNARNKFSAGRMYEKLIEIYHMSRPED
jgi:glycosyltransferase involved in cell wall biosynthesis